MNQQELRASFLSFFEGKGHTVVPSGPIVPWDDPTLLFTNAGMNQFKDVFLGTGTRPYKRAADTQKCMRVSGKHNDLEEVGHDSYHHTFFEMLGNWSFGDYFKKEAVAWAWELLTEVWKLPKERLWVTVFGGDEADGLEADTETEKLWQSEAGIPPERILRFGKADNFWEMGDTGPCGPCTEIHLDRGGPDDDPADGADPKLGINAGNERFIELWNLVFIEFNRLGGGALESLPHKHVDTGLGFERVLSAVQGKHSNYDTDLFTPIFAHIGTLLGHEYGASDSPQDVAFRVVADHMRAVSSALADGVLPANTGRGYVLRRLIRRAARYGRQELGAEDPFLFEVAPAVAAVLGSAFPEIPQRMEHIQLLVRNEEEAFARTLGRGLVRFQELADKVQKSKRSTLGGAEAYDLYATYGFPEDLVELMARERSLQVDREGWVEAHRRHQEASRSEGKFKQKVPPELLANLSATRSTYHEEGERAGCVVTHGRLLGAGSENAFVVLGESPFYAEAGGQIGDVGTIATTDGVFEFQVEDTQRIGEVVVHLGTVVRGSLEDGAEVRAVVDTARRDRTRKNHTATHLLHKALRDELGDHVRQQGSYVGPDRLRFDFSHPAALSKEELEGVERAVSEQIAKDTPVTTTVRDLEEAKQAGAMALFGEKYADRVRVVSVSDYSMELCGGTHVRRLGEIESVVVTHEGSAAAGVRRIEAVAGAAAARAALDQRKEREVERAQALERKQEAKERDRARRAEIRHRIGASTGSLLEEAEKVGEITVAAGVVDREDPEALRALADRIRVAAGECIVILAGRGKGGFTLVVAATKGAVEAGFKAGEILKTVAAEVGGKGGGRPEMAQGRAPASADMEAALGQAKQRVVDALRSN